VIFHPPDAHVIGLPEGDVVAVGELRGVLHKPRADGVSFTSFVRYGLMAAAYVFPERPNDAAILRLGEITRDFGTMEATARKKLGLA
jgi:hypothetical protein